MQTCTQCQTQTTHTEFDDNICDGCWYLNQNPTTKEDARSLAIDWQNWQSEQSLSIGELLAQQKHFEDIALKFGLTVEFIENGII